MIILKNITSATAYTPLSGSTTLFVNASNELQIKTSTNAILNPMSAASIKTSLESLTNADRLDSSAVKGSISTFNWNQLPAPADYIGTAYIADVGVGGSFWRSTGTEWNIVGGQLLFAKVTTPSALLTNLTNAQGTIIPDIIIPGGLLGPTGVLEVRARYVTSSANTKIVQIYYGGTNFSGATTSGGVGIAASNVTGGATVTIVNENVAKQTGSNGSLAQTINGAVTWQPGTVDTSVNQPLSFRAYLTAPADTIGLVYYEVFVRR